MTDIYSIYQSTLTAVAVCGLAAIAAAVGFYGLSRVILPVVCWIRRHKVDALLVAPFVLFFAYYGGSKIASTVTFPRTDPETWYLMDNGSYVTNDWVHVAYTKNPIVPNTASIFIEGLSLSYTNQSDWAEHSFLAYSNTLGTATSPFDMPYPAASNFNWIVYTDWTPPPTTHTNGVAYAAWQRPISGATNILATVKTGIYIGPLRLSPPAAMTNGVPTTATLLSTPQQETTE